jgi:hypothetical protein
LTLDHALHLLIHLELELNKETSLMQRMIHDGADHFHIRQRLAMNELNDASLDIWSREQQSLAALMNAQDFSGLSGSESNLDS